MFHLDFKKTLMEAKILPRISSLTARFNKKLSTFKANVILKQNVRLGFTMFYYETVLTQYF